MTLEELRAEAKRQGYNLVPIPKSKPKMLPCPVCGKARRDYRCGLDIQVTAFPDKQLDWKKVHYSYYGICRHCNEMKGPVIIDPDKKEMEKLVINAWNEYITKGETYWNEHPEQKPE